MFQFSIRTLFIVTTLVAIGLWMCMVLPFELVGAILGLLLPFMGLSTAIAGGIYLRGDHQAFAIGVAIPLSLIALVSQFSGFYRFGVNQLPELLVALVVVIVIPIINGFVAVYMRRWGQRMKQDADKQEQEKAS